MDKCREEFEKIPYVKAILEGVHSSIVWFGEGKYHTSFFGFDGAVNRLNGAWVVYQNQQAKVEELQALYTQQGINMLKLQKRVDAALKLIESWNEIAFDKTTHWTEGYEEGCYHCAAQLEQALKGEGQ
ncbi:TPA: hypothetical protein ACNVU8_003309 [Acinetobacter baumannii]